MGTPKRLTERDSVTSAGPTNEIRHFSRFWLSNFCRPTKNPTRNYLLLFDLWSAFLTCPIADVLDGFLQMIRMMVSINTIKHLNRHAEETRGLPTVCALHRVPGTQRRLLSNLCLMDRLKR